jgi:pSer/pThr/pTyr-binding forkhead associated (FHA) protein
MGIPRISFHEEESMGRGELRVEAALTADPDAPSRVYTREPRADDADSTRAVSSDTADRMGLAPAGARLVVIDDEGAEAETIAITKDPVVIGRMSTNDVVLSDPNVSRRHAELRRAAGRWLLVDLGSTNGTTVNGKLAREHELSHGDRLMFGSTKIRFETGT